MPIFAVDADMLLHVLYFRVSCQQKCCSSSCGFSRHAARNQLEVVSHFTYSGSIFTCDYIILYFSIFTPFSGKNGQFLISYFDCVDAEIILRVAAAHSAFQQLRQAIVCSSRTFALSV